MERICLNCMHWRISDMTKNRLSKVGGAAHRNDTGHCIRHAPRPEAVHPGSQPLYAIWPLTMGHERCGEWDEKETIHSNQVVETTVLPV